MKNSKDLILIITRRAHCSYPLTLLLLMARLLIILNYHFGEHDAKNGQFMFRSREQDSEP